MKLEELLNKTCLIGLRYYDANNDLLKLAQFAGAVVKVDKEKGVSVRLNKNKTKNTIQTDNTDEALFILPPLLTPWFIAPSGHYKNAENHVDIIDPDYFVTWDVHKTKESTPEGEHEWWGWEPCTVPPRVN